MKNDEISCSEMIMSAVNVSTSPVYELPNIWKRVVSRIKTSRDEDEEKRMPIGERLAGNTRVVDLKNGTLLIETDHPGWIQYLRIYQKFIITGLKKELPEIKITNLAFRNKGSNANLCNNYDDLYKKEQSKLTDKIIEQDKLLNKQENTEKIDYSKRLPPELLEKFESIKKSLLTEDEK